ncbi:MAG: RidA family protein [Actinomycetota bacterium]
MSAPAFAPFGVGGGVVVSAGIAALDPATLTPLFDDFDAQARWVLARLDMVLGEAGATREDLLRVECFLADRQWFGAWNAHYAEHFGTTPPARTTVVCGLPVDGLLIEVQVIASIT